MSLCFYMLFYETPVCRYKIKILIASKNCMLPLFCSSAFYQLILEDRC